MCAPTKQSLVYLGNVIGGGELKIDVSKIEVIRKLSTPTNVTKLKEFCGCHPISKKVHGIIFNCGSATSCHNGK
jgi:hypothetical protein